MSDRTEQGPEDVDVEADLNAGLDLSPRTDSTPRKKRSSRRWGPVVVLALVLVAGGVVISQFLGSSLDYYCNVDEIGVKESCSGGRTLRVQGTVERGSLVKEDTRTRFIIAFNGKMLPVVYDGDPGGMFQECIPVVVRGRMEGNELLGNQLEVKHSNEYVAENEARIDTAETAECPQAA